MTDKERKRENNRIRYNYLKRINKCVVCGKNYADASETLCEACKDKRDKYVYVYNKEQHRASERARRARYKEEHKCIRCGVQLPAERTLLKCERCRDRDYRWNRAHAKKVITYQQADYMDLCVRCRKKPQTEGRKVCADCLSVMQECMRRMRQRKYDLSKTKEEE